MKLLWHKQKGYARAHPEELRHTSTLVIIAGVLAEIRTEYSVSFRKFTALFI